MAVLANLTVVAISLSRGFSGSPAFTLPRKSFRDSYTITNSHFKNQFSSVIYSKYRTFRSFTIAKTEFENFASSAIRLDRDDESTGATIPTRSMELREVNTTMKDADITEKFKIIQCVFLRLANFEGGGAICIGPDSGSLLLEIRYTGFRSCRANLNGGAISYKGSVITIRQSCFDKCYCFEKGQAVYTFNADAEFDQSTIQMCSMDRPCGGYGAITMQHFAQKIVASNISWNTVAEKGAAVETLSASQFTMNYVMVSHNTGSSLFTFTSDTTSRHSVVHHCSIIYNSIDRSGPLFEVAGTLSLEADNFIGNKFNKFAVGGSISIVRRITVDFELRDNKLENCEVTNRDGAYKVSFIDANMAPMMTWECWAMGAASPTATQSIPIIKNLRVEKQSTGMISFIIVTLTGLVPTMAVYYWCCAEKPKDLTVLDDVKISNT